MQDLRADNQALREEVRTATTAMAEAEGVVDALSRRSDTVNKALLSELEYFYSTKQPAEMLAVECIKTQLASSLIHLQTGGCPATLRMTSYSSHKASGQVCVCVCMCVCVCVCVCVVWCVCVCVLCGREREKTEI